MDAEVRRQLDLQSLGPFDPRGFDRTLLDDRELRDYLPALRFLTYIFIFGSSLCLTLLSIFGLLVAPLWTVLLIPLGCWSYVTIAARRMRDEPRRFHVHTTFAAAVSTLLFVPFAREPVSTLMVFVELAFLAHCLFASTPRMALRLWVLVLASIFGVRVAQTQLGSPVGLAPYPVNWAAMMGVGWVLVVGFLVVWMLTYSVWQQKLRGMQAQAELDRAYQDLRALERSRSEFLSSITHDLKTPLVTIHGYLDLALRQQIAPGLAQGLRVAKRNATRLQHLIEDLLLAADPQSARTRLRFEQVSLAEVIEEERASFHNLAGSKQLQIVMRTEGAPVAWADRQRVGQILGNLLDNAIRFSPERATVEIGAAPDGPGETRMWIQDAGPGIPPEHIKHLFETHYIRAQDERAKPGMGMGLVICQRLATAMGGRISVESRPGQGTRFDIVFPTREPGRVETAPADRRRALVLDDESDVLELVAYHLRTAGFDPVLIQNGTAALERAMQEDFELILLDVNVPGLTGVEVSRRQREARRQGKILLFSALIRHDAERLLLEARADGFLPKPFGFEQIAQVLSEAAQDGTSAVN